jgi:hypothetical protein
MFTIGRLTRMRVALAARSVDGLSALRRCAQPIDATLFLAGEALAPNGGNGTVHGAIASGRRAADLVLRRAEFSNASPAYRHSVSA